MSQNSFAKTASCAAVAAVSLGVTIGLVASSAANSLYTAPTAVQPAVGATVVATPANVVRGVSRVDNQVLQASIQDNGMGQTMESTSTNNWAVAAFMAASAAAGAVFFALRSRANSAYEAIRDDPEAALGNAGRAIGVATVATAIAGSANAASLTFDELQSLSYLEVKGSGLANTCSIITDSTGSKLSLRSGNYRIENMCLEPSSFQVRVPSADGKTVSEFEKSKLMTRLTYTLDGIRADLSVGGGGDWTIKEIDGIDSAPTTVQLAGGERVPFLFSVKNLNAKGDAGQFLGQFDVPSYRGATFLDPKGRGGVTGYETAVALPAPDAGDSEELKKENLKSTAAGVGTIAFKVAKVNAETGEIAGVFESIQPSDTDLGAKAPKDIKTSGVWYGRISPA